ncbi:PREDICTED: integrin alpha-PS4-like [Nicrophorus vespilloides]|uniref:Integrin alpha-PS4-like n=1 Tax=Nicrophorus vespilloides TaxID=110193 RepID=A0ABM1MSI8_NICVS|nr:PREDICTED: integrin alpha-PS4-like [Nicrophorus vespilloides]
MILKIYCVLNIFAFIALVRGSLFDALNHVEFHSNQKDDYFGYAIHLQQSNPPRLISGAPKGGVDQIGSVFVCDVNNPTNCKTHYTVETDAFNEIRNSSLFGATIEGGTQNGNSVLVCAPKFTQNYKTPSGGKMTNNYFTNGACYYLSDIEKNSRIGIFASSEKTKQLVSGRYNHALSEFGFSAAYNHHNDTFLIGTPGQLDFTGNAVRLIEEDIPVNARRQMTKSSNKPYDSRDLFEIPQLKKFHIYEYRGYAVALVNVGKIYAVLGAPRANRLRGQFEVISHKTIVQTELGSSPGSYFGSVFCVLDINGDGVDELLVGAPTFKEKFYDQGKVFVYFYENEKFAKKYSLLGHEERGRFGSAMSNLGKITGDAYDAVAISSPYENNGIGAVYIYLYIDGKLEQHQRIVMSNTNGFGFSISRGVDVTSDGNNDFAVGAYKSGKAFLIKSKPLFHYEFKIQTVESLQSFHDNPPFNFTYCLKLIGYDKVNTIITITSRQSSANQKETLIISKQHCSTVEVKPLNNDDITPLSIELKARSADDCPTCPVHSPTKKSVVTHEIPFLLNCGSDQICTPSLQISNEFNIEKLTVGSEEKISLKVNVVNSNEPAYLCKALLSLPSGIFVTKTDRNCEKNFNNCALDKILQNSNTIEYQLNTKDFQDIRTNLLFNFSLNCVNETLESYMSLPLEYKSKLETDGVSDKIVYKNKNVTEAITYNHGFYIRNIGPSPIQDFEVTFKIPNKIKSDLEDVMSIRRPQSSSQGFRCDTDLPENVEEDTNDDKSELSAAGLFGNNKDDILSCSNSKIQCMAIKCWLTMKKGQEIKVFIEVKPHIDNILKYFKNTFTAVLDLEYVENKEKLIKSSEVVLEDTIDESGIAWYWILLAVIIGILLLSALTFLMYKKGFFKRKQRDEMKEEINKIKTKETFGEIEEETET